MASDQRNGMGRSCGRRRGIGGMLAAALLAAACAEGVFEVSPGDVFVLTSVNGAALPVSTVETPVVVYRVLSDTLRFNGAGRYEQIRWMSEQEAGSDSITLQRIVSTGVVRPVLGGATLESDVCSNPRVLALCIAPDTARTAGGMLVLRGSVPPAGVKWYEAQ